jgi:hypothetical protein
VDALDNDKNFDDANSLRAKWRGVQIEDRMKWKQAFVPHPRAMKLTRTIVHKVDLCRWSKAGDGMLIVGETGSGKTRLVNHLLEHYRAERADLPERSIRPAIAVSIPDPCRPRELGIEILRALGDPIAGRTRVSEITHRAHQLMVDCQTRLVMIDNFHDVPELRRARGIEHICSWVRNLIDHVPALFVLLGSKQAEVVVEGNPQLRRRCAYRSPLQYFDFHTLAGGKEFAQLIRNMESRLPLVESSALLDAQTLTKIYAATGGIFSYLIKILDASVVSAVKDARERIQDQDLEAAFIEIHGDGYRSCNPFTAEFSPRVLNRDGEPFAGLLP